MTSDIFRTIEEIILRIVDEEGILAMDKLSGEENYHNACTLTRTSSNNLVLASKLREISPVECTSLYHAFNKRRKSLKFE